LTLPIKDQTCRLSLFLFQPTSNVLLIRGGVKVKEDKDVKDLKGIPTRRMLFFQDQLLNGMRINVNDSVTIAHFLYIILLYTTEMENYRFEKEKYVLMYAHRKWVVRI
jgi:hypothetical protein